MTELERCKIAKAKGYKYDLATGNVIGIKRNPCNIISNKNSNGYIYLTITINKKTYEIMSHRYAWYLYYGELPNNFIDHIDGNPANNKIDNLRDVTHQQNMFNKKAKGYRWHKHTRKFESRIRINKKLITVGYFDNEQEAKNAYLEAKKIYHIIPNINPNNGLLDK